MKALSGIERMELVSFATYYLSRKYAKCLSIDRRTVKVEQLGMKMREGRLRWYGHVMRRDQEYVGRKMMEMELPGRFLDAVKEDMQEVGVKETDIENRKMWRMMIRCGHP